MPTLVKKFTELFLASRSSQDERLRAFEEIYQAYQTLEWENIQKRMNSQLSHPRRSVGLSRLAWVPVTVAAFVAIVAYSVLDQKSRRRFSDRDLALFLFDSEVEQIADYSTPIAGEEYLELIQADRFAPNNSL